jgi:small-conductance mechanosensitive channel
MAQTESFDLLAQFNVSAIVESILDPTNTIGIAFRIVIILLVIWLAVKLVKRLMNRVLRDSLEDMGIGDTRFPLMVRLVSLLIWMIGLFIIIMMIPGMEDLFLYLLGASAAIGIVIGLIVQKPATNIVTGILMAVFRPFKVGDTVTIKDTWGVVEEITLWHTTVRTFQDNARMVIPNGIMSDEIITNHHMTDQKRQMWIDIGIAYDADIDRAREVMLEYANAHPVCMHGKDVEPLVRLTELGDFAVNMRLYCWSETPGAGYGMACDLREQIKKHFDAEGIEIPFPYTTMVYKKDLIEEAEQHKPYKKVKIAKPDKKVSKKLVEDAMDGE